MLLLLLFGMALAWFLQKKLYQKNWQKNLKIQVSFQDSAIYEGEESTLKEVVVNDKLLPIPALELGISMSRNLEFDLSCFKLCHKHSVTNQLFILSYNTKVVVHQTHIFSRCGNPVKSIFDFCSDRIFRCVFFFT